MNSKKSSKFSIFLGKRAVKVTAGLGAIASNLALK